MYCKEILGVRQIYLPNEDAGAQLCLQFCLHRQPSSLPLSSLSASVRLMFSQSDCNAGDLQGERLPPPKKKHDQPTLCTSPRYTSPHHPSQPRQNEVEGVSVGLKIEIASAPLIYFISIGTHLHSWELMARISMNVKAGCCAVMHLCCFVLPWKQGGSQLQQIHT